jgi:signal transduction histidine kinase
MPRKKMPRKNPWGPMETEVNPIAPAERLSILMVEDNPVDVELIQRELRRAGFDFAAAVVQEEEDFVRELGVKTPDIVLADYNLPQWRGMEALEILQREHLDVPLILVTGALGEVNAVECIKKGVTDYVLKGTLARLPISIRRALQEKRHRDERKQAEENLAHKVEELARSNRDLEQFAYVASHDLQEPLRMVATYTQLLGERYRGKIDENADKYIGYAVEGALRMQTLIQDLLAFSRVGRSGKQHQRMECKLAVDLALQNLQASIQESGAVISVGALPAVEGNRTQLTLLFQNMIGNAIKFRGKNQPAIQITAEDTSPASNDGNWLFTVADNGIGIAPEQVENVFVIFKRLHTREEYPGNGIGLSICKKIIEQHGGKIWIESQPGQGTTFKFTLPKTAAQADAQALAATAR